MKIQVKHSNAVDGSNQAIAPQSQFMLDGELAVNYASTDPRLFIKLSNNNIGNIPFGNHTNPYWHSGNDGAGSGLDADILDGQQGSYYLDYNNFVNTPPSELAGDTSPQLGGNLDLNSNDITGTGNVNINGNLTNTGNVNITGNITVSGTVDGRNISTDGAKLNGIENNATRDQTASEILTAIKTVDGPGSGLNADTLDNQQGSYYLNYNNFMNTPATDVVADTSPQLGGNLDLTGRDIIGTGDISINGDINCSGTVEGRDIGSDGLKLDGIESGATADQTAAEILTAIKTVDGSGSGLDADTVDGIQGANFLRSDVSDTMAGQVRLDSSVFFREGTTDKVQIQWQGSLGELVIKNLEHNRSLRLSTAQNGLLYYHGSFYYKIWYAANDGAGSGLDADTVDGLQASDFARIGAENNQYFEIDYNGVNAYFNRDSNGDLLSFQRSGTEEGSIEIDTSRVYFRTTSDYRRKTNILPIENSVEVVKALKPSSYNWIDDGRLDHGFLAHELQELIPGSASGEKDEVDEHGQPVYQKVDLTTVVPFLTAALKEALERIESLEDEVSLLKNG